MDTTEIPPRYREKIEVKPGRDLQEGEVLTVFMETNRPYLTRRQVQNRLEGDYARATVLARLATLCEVGILKKDEMKSSIYWLEHDDSNWPIPPDVEVEPSGDGLTLSEATDLPFVPHAVVGVFLIVFSSAVIWIGGYLEVAEIHLWLFDPTGIVAIGLLIALVGWALIMLSAMIWINNKFEIWGGSD